MTEKARKRPLGWILSLTLITVIASISFALVTFTARAVVINPNLPGSNAPDKGPVGIVANFYEFALLIGGLLAFGAIVYGGVMYTLSAGNPSSQSDARGQITDALVGLLLLAGAYILLNIINPDLTQLRLPTLQQLQTSAPSAACSPPCTAPQQCVSRGGVSSCQ